jgi:ribosomal protein L11
LSDSQKFHDCIVGDLLGQRGIQTKDVVEDPNQTTMFDEVELVEEEQYTFDL